MSNAPFTGPALPPASPERIHGWLDTHLSIARHYGGIDYNGHRYVIDLSDPEQPLVREDVLKREAKAAKKKGRTDPPHERQTWMQAPDAAPCPARIQQEKSE